MKTKLLSLAKYLISLSVAVALMYYVFRGWDFKDIMARFAQVNYGWVFISIAFSIISHFARAYRWNLLLRPVGYNHLSIGRTFNAVMVGYLANLVAPRLGEITRCGVMKRIDNVNMSASIGTVVAERVFDFLILLSLILLGLFLEFDRLSNFFIGFLGDRANGMALSDSGIIVLIAFGFIIAAGIFTLWWFREKVKQKPFYYKIRSFISEMINGFTSVLRLENKTGFWVSTLLIWALYYIMAFVLFYSVESTHQLGLVAGLSVLIMGGLGMSAPVQGGLGVYHLLVGSILLTYGIAEKDGYFFATLVHTSQTLMVVVVGGISLVITMVTKRKLKEK